MPVVKVYGLPTTTTIADTLRLRDDLIEAMITIKGLGVTKKTITFFFPKDRIPFDVAREVVVFVDGLFVRPLRTTEVRNELAKRIGETIKTLLPDIVYIECFVRPFDPEQGFWASSG